MVDKNHSGILKNGYTQEEMELLYSLGKTYIDITSYNSAEKIFNGLITIDPDHVSSWIALSVINFIRGDLDASYSQAKQALRINSNLAEAQLVLITVLLSQSDYTTAGAYLGEVKELVDSKRIQKQDLVRYFKAQLLRFEYRQ